MTKEDNKETIIIDANPKKPFYKKGLFIACSIIAAIILIIFAVMISTLNKADNIGWTLILLAISIVSAFIAGTVFVVFGILWLVFHYNQTNQTIFQLGNAQRDTRIAKNVTIISGFVTLFFALSSLISGVSAINLGARYDQKATKQAISSTKKIQKYLQKVVQTSSDLEQLGLFYNEKWSLSNEDISNLKVAQNKWNDEKADLVEKINKNNQEISDLYAKFYEDYVKYDSILDHDEAGDLKKVKKAYDDLYRTVTNYHGNKADYVNEIMNKLDKVNDSVEYIDYLDEVINNA